MRVAKVVQVTLTRSRRSDSTARQKREPYRETLLQNMQRELEQRESRNRNSPRAGLTILGMIIIPAIIVIFLVMRFYPNACVPGIRQHTPLVEH